MASISASVRPLGRKPGFFGHRSSRRILSWIEQRRIVIEAGVQHLEDERRRIGAHPGDYRWLHVSLTKGDIAGYLNDLAFIEQSLATIQAERRLHEEIIQYHTEESGE